MAFKHCKHCAWGFEHDEWVDSAFCPNCGSRLKPRPSAEPRREEVEHIEPYADVDPVPTKTLIPVKDICGELKRVAHSHPYLAGIGAVAVGLAAVWAAPTLVAVGTAIVWIGAIITGCGFLSVAYDRDQAIRWLEVGLLTLFGGAFIILAGYTLAVLGICSAAGGVGIAGKTATEDLLKWNLKRKLDKMPIKELIALSRQMDA
jgi:hypothetical protein